jgi:hypothetical protein
MNKFTMIKAWIFLVGLGSITALSLSIYWHEMEWALIALVMFVAGFIVGCILDVITDKQTEQRRTAAKIALPEVIKDMRKNGELKPKIGAETPEYDLQQARKLVNVDNYELTMDELDLFERIFRDQKIVEKRRYANYKESWPGTTEKEMMIKRAGVVQHLIRIGEL